LRNAVAGVVKLRRMILNIAAYHFVVIDDPDALASRLRECAEAVGLRGTVGTSKNRFCARHSREGGRALQQRS